MKPARLPRTARGVRTHIVSTAELHLHFIRVASDRRWVLVVSTTAMCGTDNCLRVIMRRHS